MRGQKTPRIVAADLIIATNFEVCDHDGDGQVKYWQDATKAQEMRVTSPYMHKEEV